MNITFIRIGTAEVARNRPAAFSIPDSSAVSEMNRI